MNGKQLNAIRERVAKDTLYPPVIDTPYHTNKFVEDQRDQCLLDIRNLLLAVYLKMPSTN